MYFLQTRWKQEGKKLRYYGLRNQSELFKNTVRLSGDALKIIQKLFWQKQIFVQLVQKTMISYLQMVKSIYITII